MLLLNRPSVLRTVREVPAVRRFSGGRLMTLAAYTVVTIDLDRAPLLRRMDHPGRDVGTPRQRHQVRGHFVHDGRYRAGTAAGCIHDFQPDDAPMPPEDGWRCADCGKRRWWHREHCRGDADLGRVRQTRVVVASASLPAAVWS